MNDYTPPSRQLEKKIFRSRQPVKSLNGQIGYIDFWSTSPSRALEASRESDDRIFESLSLREIRLMPPGPRAKAEAAWHNAFGSD